MWAQLIVCASTHSLLSVACLKYKSQALWMKSKTRSEWHSKTFEVFQRDEMKTSGAFEVTIYELFYLKIRMFFILFFFYNLLTFDREVGTPAVDTTHPAGLVSWCKILVCLPGTSNASFYQRHFTHHHTMMRSMMSRNLDLLNSSIPRHQKWLFNPNFRTNKRNFHSSIAANIQHWFKMVHNSFLGVLVLIFVSLKSHAESIVQLFFVHMLFLRFHMQLITLRVGGSG